MFSGMKLAILTAIVALTGSMAMLAATSVNDPVAPAQDAPGSLWIERHGLMSPTYYVFHGDGIAVGFDDDLGVGVGQWTPTGDRSLEAEVDFSGYDDIFVRIVPDTARFHFTGEIDETGDTMTLHYADNGLGRTTATAERKKLAPMPPEAETTTPEDTGWAPVVGIVEHGPDDASVAVEEYGGRPIYSLEHADGTWVSINPWVGPGVGLTAEPDEYHGILTAWFVHDHADAAPLVGQASIDPTTGAVSIVYGGSFGFTDSAQSEPMEQPVTEVTVDPDWWPSIGSLWLEEQDGGPSSATVMHADGTMLSVDPYRGIGVGTWFPTGPDTASVQIDYYDTDPTLEGHKTGMSRLRGELSMDAPHETATLDFTVENDRPLFDEAWQETGSATLIRHHLGT